MCEQMNDQSIDKLEFSFDYILNTLEEINDHFKNYLVNRQTFTVKLNLKLNAAIGLAKGAKSRIRQKIAAGEICINYEKIEKGKI